MKPRGLWYGVNGGWQEWCRSEMPHWDFPWVYRVDISRANILKVDTVEKVRALGENYPNKNNPLAHLKLRQVASLHMVDWAALAKEYDGVEFSPYLYSIRLASDVMWYYTVDCASGCVWNVDKISITLHKRPRRKVILAPGVPPGKLLGIRGVA